MRRYHIQLLCVLLLAGLSAPPAASDGAGLQNLRDRVASVGGTIDIVSRPGRGTEINIEIDTK